MYVLKLQATAYLIVFCFFCSGVVQSQDIVVPTAGNTFSSVKNGNTIGRNGIKRWEQASETLTTYVRVTNRGDMSVKISGSVPVGVSELSVSILGKTKKLQLTGADTRDHDAGTWQVNDTGYVAIRIAGLKKTGQYFADIESLKISGTVINDKTSYVKNNEGNFFYWGRRGPSTHMSYMIPEGIDAEWFYNEVTVPKGNDVIGSYFMANGFAEGYFGMQVNSESERRVLFSVWSPFNTDNPKEIPEDQKIMMLKKGEGVHTGEFGNEGSGGQSFLRYNWKAGNTYKFLLKGIPDGDSHTIYTAYFFAPEENQWRLIASFRRPKTATYLKRFHSFLENFNPNYGDLERKVYFGNQWVRDSKGVWHELTNGRFTADNTARVGYRKDYSGGAEKDRFYLRNFGFFKEYTDMGKQFQRDAGKKAPVVKFDELP